MRTISGLCRLRAGALVLAVAAVATIAACADSSSPARGPVIVQLTDAPMDDVDSVWVHVVRVDARMAGTDSVEAANVGGSGWTTLATPNRMYELLSLRADTTVLDTASIAVGAWNSVRIVIDPMASYVILKDGTRLDGRTNMGSSGQPGIKFPSAAQSGIKVQLAQPMQVTGDTAILTLDFDAAESFGLQGTTVRDGLIFRPVVRAAVTIDD